MSSVRFPLVGGKVMRGTRLDACGVPVYGNKTRIVSSGWVSVAQTANYEDGEEISVVNADGQRCVQKDAEPELTNLSLDVMFCDVDPEFYSLLTGFPQIIDPQSGNTIGFKVNRGVRPGDVRTALEVWSNAQGSIACDDSGAVPYGYLLWPFLSGGRVGDYTIENNAVTFSVTGMTTKDGSRWGEGPYNVMLDALGVLSPLIDAIEPLDHQSVFVTSVPPPENTPGMVPLDDPDQGEATGAEAGIPGAFTPLGDVRPMDFEALVEGDLTASPATAWTTGQHVILGDGSFASWSGTAWVEGKAE